jgi:hypothetical protein
MYNCPLLDPVLSSEHVDACYPRYVMLCYVMFMLCVRYIPVLKNSLTNRDSSVSIVIRLRAGRTGFDSWQGQGIFLFTTASRPAPGPNQSLIKWAPGINRPGREADHSPPSSTEIKIAWNYTSTPPYAFMA